MNDKAPADSGSSPSRNDKSRKSRSRRVVEGALPAAELVSDVITERSPMPKWYQLKRLLMRKIKEGKFSPDVVFCNQEELMAEYGVSYATVARALSELVREGYLFRKRGVGTFVRSRAERRGANAIGMLVMDREQILQHPAFSRLVAGISEPLRAAGYNLSFIFVNAESEATRPGCIADIVGRAKVKALVAPTQPTLVEAYLRPLAEQGMPIVPINLDAPSLGRCAVHFDLSRATEMATAHLIECGYPRVLLMIPEDEEAPPRMAGYRRALAAAGIKGEYIFTEPRKRPLPPEVLHALSGMKGPVGIVASDDVSALTTIRTARDAGWTIPETLGVVGVGDVLPPELFEAPLTTIHVPFVEMGRIASAMTLSLLDGRVPDPPVQHLAPRLVVRSTTADLTKVGIVQQD